MRLQVSELDEEIERLEREYKDVARVGLRAKGLWNASYDDDKAMTEMLRQCTTRDDFVVRQGPRTAWSELRGATGRSKKIGIYLPAGRHWLKYAVGFSEEFGGVGYQRFQDGDPRDIAGAVSVELGREPEVYEFRLTVRDEEPPRIEVVGRDNSVIHEHTLPQKARGMIFKTTVNGGFAFPSEFKPKEEARPYFLKPALLPVTDLGILHGAAMFRLWIESDAPACMPAFYVAANYSKVTALRYRHDNPSTIERATDSDTEFVRLFEPYDRSGRFIFREEIFLRPCTNEAPEQD